MAASYNDMFVLSQNTTFQGRVQAALIQTCVNVASEGWTPAFHRERSLFVVQILSFTGSPNPYFILFANSVATDPTVIGDATQAGTVALTAGNISTQQALVSDTHIANAISGQFNAFIREPMV